ncbi:adenosylcobinamide-GDP ribazoletransferase [Rhodobacteraceae bacterium M382]|nr:adenosylcobinamide-GDP ribazoletransferase [Rhodobacteraceae bacterium M382]
MRKNDTRHFSLRDIQLALVLLTRLPLLKMPPDAFLRQAHAVWAFPLVGICVAGCAAVAGGMTTAAGLPSTVTAGVFLCVQILIGGAMHEDGLADTADGFWGGFTRERRLEIMKDSHIGTYGVLALIVSVGLRWATLAALLPISGFAPVLAVAALSRAAMPVMMIALPNARSTGLSQSVGRPPLRSVLVGGLIASGISLLILGLSVTLVLSTIGIALLLGLAGLAQVKIKGQTGDILGATQQVLELALLIGCLALISI